MVWGKSRNVSATASYKSIGNQGVVDPVLLLIKTRPEPHNVLLISRFLGLVINLDLDFGLGSLSGH